MNHVSDAVQQPRSVRYRFESASMCSMRFRVFIGRGGEDVTALVWLSMMKNEGWIEIGDLEIQMKGKGVFSPEFAFSRNDQVIATGSIPLAFRSEERRVGKECRRRQQHHQ